MENNEGLHSEATSSEAKIRAMQKCILRESLLISEDMGAHNENPQICTERITAETTSED